jgi:hypothetical protein
MRKALPSLAVLALIAASATPAFGGYITALQELSPSPTTFVFGVDQGAFADPAGGGNQVTGSATGSLYSVPNVGCSASDYTSFPQGDIALILRGTCAFSAKGVNAQNAGAIGYIVYDNIAEALGLFGMASLPGIPGVYTTNDVGLGLAAATRSGPVRVTFSVTPTPEPASVSLLAVGLVCVAWRRRRAGR